MTRRPLKAKAIRRLDGPHGEALRHSDLAGVVFNVSTLLQEPIGSVRLFQVDATPLVIDEERMSVEGTVRLLRTDGSVLVQAELDAVVTAICDRCLDEFALPLSLSLREEFWPPVDPVRNEVVEVPEEREGFAVVEGHIDLREAIRQHVVMARPMRADCGANCPGRPGAVEAPTEAPTEAGAPSESQAGSEPVDSRWAALQGLRDELQSPGSER